MVGGATSAASCCEYCTKHTPLCKAFTYLGGTCYLKNCNRDTMKGHDVFLKEAISGYLK